MQEQRDRGRDRVRRALEALLGIATTDPATALARAADLLARELRADNVEFFVYEAERDSLVAVGASPSPMGAARRALGLDRLPLSVGGLAVRALRSGRPLRIGDAELQGELRAVVEELGVRSALLIPLDPQGGRPGVFSAVSTRPNAFDQADADLAASAAGWVGLLLDRAELTDRRAADAARRDRALSPGELARITDRERTVALAVAQGLTNQQIARRLTLEEGTVANHVARIIRKLGLSSRTQIAVWAVERGIYRSDWAAEQDDPTADG